MTEIIRAAYATANEILRSSPTAGFQFTIHLQAGAVFEALPLSTDPLNGTLSGTPTGRYWQLESVGSGDTLLIYPGQIAAIQVHEV